MHYYMIAKFRLKSCFSINSYNAFTCDPGEADVTLETTDKMPPEGERAISGALEHCRVPGGWFITVRNADRKGLYLNDDYRYIHTKNNNDPPTE